MFELLRSSLLPSRYTIFLCTTVLAVGAGAYLLYKKQSNATTNITINVRDLQNEEKQ